MTTYFKDKLDVIVFGLVLCLLVGTQIFDRINNNKQVTPADKLLATANVTKICVAGPNGTSTCYDIKGMNYNILLKPQTDNTSQLILTYGKGQ